MRIFAARRSDGPTVGRSVFSVCLLSSLVLGNSLAAQDRTARDELKRFFAQAVKEEGIVGVGGFRSFFYLHPESGLAIIINLNTSPPSESAGPEVKPRIGRIFSGMLQRFVNLIGPGEQQ